MSGRMSGGISPTSASSSHDPNAHTAAAQTGAAMAPAPQPAAPMALIRCSQPRPFPDAVAIADLLSLHWLRMKLSCCNNFYESNNKFRRQPTGLAKAQDARQIPAARRAGCVADVSKPNPDRRPMPKTFAASAALSLALALAVPAAAQTTEALQLAVVRDDPAAIDQAIRAGSNPSATTEHGSLLAIAAMSGKARAVRALLAHGADPAAPGPNGGSALSAAFF